MINIVRIYKGGRKEILDRAKSKSLGAYYIEDWRRVLLPQVVAENGFSEESFLILSDNSIIKMENSK